MKKVYGYIRVSTVKQGEGVSLEVQKEAIIRYAERNNLLITNWFEEKETAAKQGRPLFTEMMRQLKAKKADGVVIHKIDRGARNLKDWADLGNLIDQGIAIHFAHETLDLQARGGRLSADIQAVIAADYIRNLSQEAAKGITGRLKQGYFPFKAPIGYCNHGTAQQKTVDPIQGPLVRKAFELYASGKFSLKELTPYMCSLGLQNTVHKAANLSSLARMLKNPFYTGISRIKGISYNGGHEPLISPALFHKVQAILKGKTNQKVTRHDFMFRKLMSCKACGNTLTAEMQKGITYYRCHTKYCETKGIREITVTNLLQKAFETIQLNEKECVVLEEILGEAEKDWITTQEKLLTGIRLQTAQIQQKMERLTDCYVEGGLDKETFEQRKEKLLFESKTILAQEKAVQQNKDKIFTKVRRFFELSKSLIESYESADLQERRELVQIITSNLVVKGKKLMITMRSPFLEILNREELIHGGPQRNTPRKQYTPLCYIEQNTSPIISPPLSRDALQDLFKVIMDVCGNLPDDPEEVSEP